MKTVFALLFTFSALSVFAQNKPLPSTYNIDTESTKVDWMGKKVAGPHHGQVSAKSGSITVLGDEITSGNVIIDMNSINVLDLEGEYKFKLETHLKSPDFFDTAKYPDATLVIKNSKKSAKGLDITADLTIKGITQPITFTATEVKKTAESFKARAEIIVDRTKYGVVYNAGKGDKSIIKQLGDKLIYDDFTLTIELAAKK